MSELKPKILVVEDDPDSRDALCLMLSTLGYEACAYESGVDVIRDIESIKVDIALLDVMLPTINGYELMTALRKHQNFNAVPMIMVTARDRDSDSWEGYEHGADYYIIKPFTLMQLEYGLKLFLDKSMRDQEE